MVCKHSHIWHTSYMMIYFYWFDFCFVSVLLLFNFFFFCFWKKKKVYPREIISVCVFSFGRERRLLSEFRFIIFSLPHEFWKFCFYIFLIYNLLLLIFRYVYIYIYLEIYIFIKRYPLVVSVSTAHLVLFFPVLHLTVLFLVCFLFFSWFLL